MQYLTLLKTHFIPILSCIALATGCAPRRTQPIYTNPTFVGNLKGIKIDVVAPASGMNKNAIKALDNIIDIDLSLATKYNHLPYHSNPDGARFTELRNAIYDKESDVIWALCGGYGSARLFDRLKTLDKPSSPKLFIGYSDMTFLHLFFDNWDWKTIHGNMVFGLLNTNKNSQNLLILSDIINTKKANLSYAGIMPMNSFAKKTSSVEGSIIGGNLTLITNSLGTEWSINTKNRIVFIEDTGSKGYMIDRDLLHLKQAGVFNHAKAVLFGTFEKTDDLGSFALQRFADEIDIPVFRSNLFGHGKNNHPLVFGCPSVISKKGSNFTLKTKCDLM